MHEERRKKGKRLCCGKCGRATLGMARRWVGGYEWCRSNVRVRGGAERGRKGLCSRDGGRATFGVET